MDGERGDRNGDGYIEYSGKTDQGAPVNQQAWSSEAVPLMLVELLGLQTNGFDDTLRIVRPVLPQPIDHLELHGIKVSAATVDLRFEREPGGDIVPQVLAIQGTLNVEFEGIGTIRAD